MIDTKRRELEAFIREQTLGPGGMRSRFVDEREPREAHDDPNGEDQSPYDAELLNTIPAGIYSTGILFPVDDTKAEITADEKGQDHTDATPPEDVPEDEDNEPDIAEDENENVDAQSLNQMYPNSIGLTVCLDQQVANNNDLEIIISGRYYQKVRLTEATPSVGVLLEQDPALFTALLDRLPADELIRNAVAVGETKKGRPYIYFTGHPDSIRSIKQRLYELPRQECERLSQGREQTYKSLDIFKERLFGELRNSIPPDTDKGQELVAKLQEIEAFENSLTHLNNLISAYDKVGYGLWKCETFHQRVAADLPIPKISKGKRVYTHQREPMLANVREFNYEPGKTASLSVNLQYSRHTRNARTSRGLFLKVQLINTSTHFSKGDTNNGKSYFSMASEEVNKRCFFGVGIRVRSRHLLPYRSPDLDVNDLDVDDLDVKPQYNEDEVNRYIYRQYRDYGLGHGCSLKWGEHQGLRFVSTEYIPSQDTPDVDPMPPPSVFTDNRFLRFRWLSTLSDTTDQEILTGLRDFVDAYQSWIDRQQDASHPAIATQIRLDCQKDQTRMLENIEHLLTNHETLKCFRLMNTAMFIQLWHSVKAKDGAVNRLITQTGFKGFFEQFYKEMADDKLFSPTESAAWRPFQLAFILLNLDGIFQRADDPEWRARNEQVDLVWFPTGGGKTEAYLGLIALTIINRRRRFKDLGGGTAVLMRYTLRLLTAQQFQRATLLIMALELMRRWGTHDLGDEEPIYIGLFVGASSLPNKLDELNDELTALRKAQSEGKTGRSRIPLSRCPWCGHELSPIKFDKKDGPFSTNRIFIACSREDVACAFSTNFATPRDNRQDQDPIPVSLCDEEIYQHPPTLLFGTVDKFAQLAHKVSDEAQGRHNDSRRLFGKGNWETGKPKRGYQPPDLIIQDELHLMMGPLGSAVALFESAIDQLCTREAGTKRTRPKIISSTATTRNTPLQIMALFDRKVNLFPKPGVNCDDSFFAFYKRNAAGERGEHTQYLSKRRYIGILPTGRTQMWMQLRLAAILFTHRAIFEEQALGNGSPFDPNAFSKELTTAIDSYHTVLTYFNSLREVGKTESQVYSYLVKEIRRVFNNVVYPGKAMRCFYTFDNSFHVGELTGRLSGEEVVSQLGWIGSSWSPVNRLAHQVGDIVKRGIMPPDLVIATNMISVGIDIARFNTMIVNCMPRNIAEYIQASSRVARDKPGLVITVHHPFRSRDLSHYERFVEFHEKMYSFVEPISITPFTLKALERYLPLYIATILRHQLGFPNRRDANQALHQQEQEHLIGRLMSYFQRRMTHLQGMTDIDAVVKRLLTRENIDDIRRLMTSAISQWQTEYQDAVAAKQDLMFNYRSTKAVRPQRQLYVDIDEYEDNISSELWRIPQSLRVVEPEAVIHVKQK